MSKAELVTEIAEKAGISKVDAEKALNAFTATVSDALKGGEPVRLIGFGTFTTVKKAARKGINPATKQEIDIPASICPKFKPGKALKDSLN